jgi:hypothetical protein
MAGFALTIVLLESEGLVHWAQRLDVSNPAEIAVQATGNLHRFLQPLKIESVRKRALADLDRLGWSDDPARLAAADREDGGRVRGGMQSCVAMPTTVNLPVPADSIAALLRGERIPLAASTPVQTPLPKLTAVSDGKPRVVAFAGDSMMAVGLSDILLRATAGDPNVRVIKAFKSGTGLARPDVFDWMQEYPAMIGSEHPDAVIVAIGANDGQGFVQDGKVLAFGTDAWVQVYQARIATFMNLLTQHGARVVWVGLPPMKSADYNQRTAEINRIAYTVVSQYPQATWWNPEPYLGDPTGAYREFETTPDGHATRLRAPDGIHLSDDGASLLSPTLIDWLNAAPPVNTAQLVLPEIPKGRARKVSLKRKRR